MYHNLFCCPGTTYIRILLKGVQTLTVPPAYIFSNPIVKRESETGTAVTAADDESDASATYTEAVETELVIRRTFNTTGKVFSLRLTAENMHDEGDVATMTWLVLCANPILGEHWTLSYPPFIGDGDVFSITLTVDRDVDLPTQPEVYITAVKGWQTIEEDNVIEVGNRSHGSKCQSTS